MRTTPPSGSLLFAHLRAILDSSFPESRPLLHSLLHCHESRALQSLPRISICSAEQISKEHSTHVNLHLRCHRYKLGINMPVPEHLPPELPPNSALVSWWFRWWALGFPRAQGRSRKLLVLHTHVDRFGMEGWCEEGLVARNRKWRRAAIRFESGYRQRAIRDLAAVGE